MKNLIIGLLLLPLFAVGQINDTWDAVKTGTTDMGKIYVGSTLVWAKPSQNPAYFGTGYMRFASSSSTMELPMPSSVSSNQVAVAVITLVKTGTSTGSISTPSGWAKVTEFTTSTNYNVLFAKSLNGSEPSSYDFTQTFSNFSYMWGAIFSYSNASNFTNATTGLYVNTTGFSVNTTPTTGRLCVNFCAIPDGQTISVSGDYSTNVRLGGSGYGQTIAATSVLGDGSQKTVTYSWPTQVSFASTYNGLEIY
ncbi:hypothetical protein [uncultured Draconibacterium sp.]|uniref:hypothetical protein n=1 Tax=uncultured Draconibacterium sp. TaxID=1573823 RepID=UPI0029C6B265|nr:hypothetical protein [uncultured Draconibacterium sp.]